MSVTDDDGAASPGETAGYVLQIYPRLPLVTDTSSPRCTLRVAKQATAASVVRDAAAALGLDTSKGYVLAEVRECGGEEWVMGASDAPVQRVLLWPRRAQDEHPQSEGYYFALQERGTDGSIRYEHLAALLKEREARRLATRGFLAPPHHGDCNDLCDLPLLSEESVLGALCQRFREQRIYTYAGNILVAINPFRFLPIYNPKYVKMYENHRLGALPPHVFAVADAAFHAMLRNHVNQCIVISGESGSGKTQSTNFLIHCLTALSQKGYTSGVERTILGAGPVLEAFGNAKTAHNNNSSRFGKFIQVNYLESGVVRGAVVEKYLLEKCRLVSREKSERNYHVFYYLLLGASEGEQQEFKLLQPEDYLYLKQENFHLEDKAEIKHEFKRLQQAMEMVGFLPATKKQIFSVLSAILYLGNVTYDAKEDGEGVGVGPPAVLSTLSDLLKVKGELLVEALTKRKAMTANDTLILPYSLKEAITARDSMAKSLYSTLFDWIVLRINHALLNRKDMGESVPCLSIGVLDIFGFEDFKTNSFEQFCINYANEQLQYYCNQYIFKMEQEEYQAEGIVWDTVDYTDNIGCIHLISKKPTGLFYLLDEESNFPHATDDTLLYKFKQQHQENLFFVPTPVMEPAFVIQHYAGKVKYQIKDFREKNTDHMRPDIVALLRSSERSYLRQLIGTDPVAVFRWGILRATVRTLAAFNEAGRRWAEKHTANVRRYSRLSLGELRRPSATLEQMMSRSSMTDFSFDRSEECPLEVFEDIFATHESKKDVHAKIISSIKRLGAKAPQKLRLSGVGPRRKSRLLFTQKSRSSRHKQLIPKNLIDSRSLKCIVGLTLHNRMTSLLQIHNKKKSPSISAQFQASLSRLLETLRKAEPFFVRCIRSNAEKREMHFDEALVLQQLRYTGMLETVRIRTSGYGAKYTFKEFTDQFRVLLPKEATTPQDDITTLLQKMGLEKTSYQIGKTKVFLKEVERQKLQETLHKEVMLSIVALQRWFRACQTRKQYQIQREAAMIIQHSWRRFREVTRCRAATLIQAAWRGSHQRAEYLHQREGFRNMQKLVKGSSERRRCQTLLEEKEREGEEASGENEEAQAVPRATGQAKGKTPRPPLPKKPLPKLNGQDQAGGQEKEGPDRRDEEEEEEKGETEIKPPLPALSRPRSVPLDTSPKARRNGPEEAHSTGSLQRYTKPSMMEKAERWKERRSEGGLLDPEIKRPQDLRIKGLQNQGKSISLDNVSKLSSSESDSSGASPTNKVEVRYRKRPKRKRRLAHARSGLMLKSRESKDMEYWSFPLPPISPMAPSRSSADMLLLKPRAVKFQLPPETQPDGAQFSVPRRSSEITIPSQPTTPERTGFFSKIRKRRPTPQDGNVTMARTLAERGEQATSPSGSPPSNQSTTLPNRARRNPTIKISRATRVQEQWNASLNREITDTNELRHLDEFLGNQMNDLRTRVKEMSETENIFLTATMQFRETIKTMYSLPKPHIGYKSLMKGYQSKVASLAGQKKKPEVQLVVNLFQSVLDGFIRGEIKKEEADPAKLIKKNKKRRKKDKCPDSPLDHRFSTYQVNIMQSCDLCGSFIWGMEKACMCGSCKMVCHKKCLSKIITDCSTRVSRKSEDEPGSLHFGVHVCVLTTKAAPVPMVLEMMLEHVEMNGLYTEGIYRKSGSTARARELHQLLQTDPKSSILENYSIHTITGLIKRWLRELPDPLMTFNLYNDFLHVVELPEKSEQIRAIYRKLDELPPSHFSTLERLIFHLVRVAREEAHNRMSASSLAIVFAPCILRCQDTTDPFLSMRDIAKTTTCVDLLINEQIRRYTEKMEEIQQLEYAEALAVNQLKLRRQNTVYETPEGELDEDPLDQPHSYREERSLIERIRSIKQEKDDLACRLPELDQEASDNDNLDSESSISSESLLEDRVGSLDSEGMMAAVSWRQKPEGPPKPPNLAPRPKLAAEATQKHPGQRRDGVQSMCLVPGRDGLPTPPSSSSSPGNQRSSTKSGMRFSDLDIPFIDEDDEDDDDDNV